jgi:hypothetical protein
MFKLFFLKSLEMERYGMSAEEIAAARNVSDEATARHLENRRAMHA